MTEPAGRAVFHCDNLPAHQTNADTIGVVDWPLNSAGEEFMPMSGQFSVRNGDGSVTEHEGGFLFIDAAGHPYWRSSHEQA